MLHYQITDVVYPSYLWYNCSIPPGCVGATGGRSQRPMIDTDKYTAGPTTGPRQGVEVCNKAVGLTGMVYVPLQTSVKHSGWRHQLPSSYCL